MATFGNRSVDLETRHLSQMFKKNMSSSTAFSIVNPFQDMTILGFAYQIIEKFRPNLFKNIMTPPWLDTWDEIKLSYPSHANTPGLEWPKKYGSMWLLVTYVNGLNLLQNFLLDYYSLSNYLKGGSQTYHLISLDLFQIQLDMTASW